MNDANPVPPSPWPVSIERYHSVPLFESVSSTSLKKFRQDREAFQEDLRRDIEQRQEWMRTGVVPWRMRKQQEKGKSHENVGGAFGGYFLDEEEHKTRAARLSEADAAKVKRMIEAVERAPAETWAGQVWRYLRTTAGRSEWSYIFSHEPSGIVCRIRLDRLIGWPKGHKVLNLELKTSRRETLTGFRYDVNDLSYYNQLALQDYGLRVAFPDCDVENWWAFVSSTPPHRCAILRPDPARLADAAAENAQALGEMAELIASPLENWGPRREPWEMAGVPPTA